MKAPEDDDLLDRRGLHYGLVGHVLQRDDVTAAPRAILREEDLALRVIDAIAEGVGAEATEDDRMGRADPCAREHRDRRLRDHAHVDGHAIARDYAEVGERRRKTDDLAVKLEVRERARLSRLPFPHERRARAGRCGEECDDRGSSR